jgi:hypothetical protein
MSKKYAVFITALFCIFIGGFLVAGAISPDRAQSGREVLQQLPKPTVESVFNGEFMTAFEDYCSDQFFGRDAWVGMKAAAEQAAGKRENNNIYFCKQDTLITRFDAPDQSRVDGNTGYVNQFVANAGVPVYFSLVPGQAAIWADRLPTGAPNADQKAIIDVVYGASDALYYDSYQALWDHRDEYLYYRTDHHWTSLGAYYGYVSLMEALGMEPVPLERYEKTVVSERFYGTTFSTSGLGSIQPDSIWTYVPDGGLQVTSYFSTAAQEGSLYNPSALEGIDQYTYFMGGNQVLSIIKNPNVDGPKLLILRDSYADSMVPFLTQHFSEIHMVDLRYNRGSVPAYIKEAGIDMALVLYSVPNYVTDTNFFTLRQK